MTICRRDTQKKLAAKQSSEMAVNPSADRSEYNLMLGQLAQYKQRLKTIKSRAGKQQVKRDELLPQMKPYIDGVLESKSGVQDLNVIYYLIWSLDADDIDECLRVAEYATQHDMAMPEQFSRDLTDFLAEEVAVRTIKAWEKGQALDHSAFTASSYVKGNDMTDEIAAKINKAMGLVLHDDKPDQALNYYNTAVDLWDRVGVKKLINELNKKIKTEQ